VRWSKKRWAKEGAQERILRSLDPLGGEKGAFETHRLAEIALVDRALSELDPVCREILRLRYFEEPPASYQSIAKRLGLAQGSIGPWRARCLKRLMVRIRQEREELDLSEEATGHVS
jgi:RNA polymerase sigma factor (sigma-70 family)